MDRVPHDTQHARRVRDFAVSLSVAGIATPAFAATGLMPELTADEWKILSLVGFVILLGVGILLRIRQKRLPPIPVWPVTTQPTHRRTIGEDRPNASH